MKKRILVIDDDAIYRKVIQKLLCGSYKLIFADNHIDALKLTKSEEPNLIIADLNMPGVAGEQLILQIIQTLYYPNIPIIVITGMDDDSLKERLFSLGISEYLTKPIDRNKLKGKIADLLDVSYID